MSVRGLTISLALASALLAAPPVAAQQAGTAMTAESGGRQTGCVEWRYETMARPQNKNTQQVLVHFTFTNRCQHEVSVMLYRQTADYAQSVSDGGGIVLAPGEVYGGPKRIRNYIFFNPPKDRFLNFWVIQSDLRFSFKNNNILDMNRCNPNFSPVKNSKRVYPPCPPSNAYR